MFRVSVVGHRDLGDPRLVRHVARRCADVLARVAAARPDVVAASALAVGADTLYAEAAVSLGLPLEVVRPFAGYDEDFALPGDRSRYAALRAAARLEVRLPYAARSEEAYAAAMAWIVDHSDLLVAVWDGRPGATGAAVERAVRQSRDWYHIETRGPSAPPRGPGPERSPTTPCLPAHASGSG